LLVLHIESIGKSLESHDDLVAMICTALNRNLAHNCGREHALKFKPGRL
jgi:hypothetical protein